MFFTLEDYRKIEDYLKRTSTSLKDTEFDEAITPLSGLEEIAFVLGGRNVKAHLKDIVEQLFSLGVSDFLNVTDKYNQSYIDIKEAIDLIPFNSRKLGQVITFVNKEGNWVIYQFKGYNTLQWSNITLWFNLSESVYVNSILPDEEDLTKTEKDEQGNAKLKLRDKVYNPDNFSGMGRVYLRKNIVDEENILYQELISKPNTIYHILYDYDLNMLELFIPENCVLQFEGGSFKNGTIIGNNTTINSAPITIFNTNITLKGSWNVKEAYPEWFGAKGDGITDDSYYILKCINSFYNTILTGKYYITNTIVCLLNKSISGTPPSEIIVDEHFTGLVLYNYIPKFAIIAVLGRDAEYLSERKSMGNYISNIKIIDSSGLETVGLYLGTFYDRGTITLNPVVNYSVQGYNFNNIVIVGTNIGILIKECWQCYFLEILVLNTRSKGVHICGQSVNNLFSNCFFYDSLDVLCILGEYYNSILRKPEGINFSNTFIGGGVNGVFEYNSLAFNFSNCIIDLNSKTAVIIKDGDGMSISNSYIATSGSDSVAAIHILEESTKYNNTAVTISKNRFAVDSGYLVYVGGNRSGVIIKDNFFPLHVVRCENTKFIVIKDNQWLGEDSNSVLIFFDLSYDYTCSVINNRFKITGNLVKDNIIKDKNNIYYSSTEYGIIKAGQIEESLTYSNTFINKSTDPGLLYNICKFSNDNILITLFTGIYFLDSYPIYIRKQSNSLYIYSPYPKATLFFNLIKYKYIDGYFYLYFIVPKNNTIYKVDLRIDFFRDDKGAIPLVPYSLEEWQEDLQDCSIDTGQVKFDDIYRSFGVYFKDTWRHVDGSSFDSRSFGTFSDKPTDIPLGFPYFCIDRSTVEGSRNGIMIYYADRGLWVDALGRIVS